MKSKLFTKKGDETILSLSGLIELLFGARKKVIRVMVIFMVIGLFVAIFSKKEFKTGATFIPQASGSGIGGGLGGLAAIAGINLSSLGSSAEIPSTIYPQIMGSLSFQKELLYSEFNFEGFEESMSYYEFFTEHYDAGVIGKLQEYTIGLPVLIYTSIKGQPSDALEAAETDSLIETVTFEEHQLIKQLREQLEISVNEFDGYVQITATMPEPRVAAQLVLKAQQNLQERIILLKSRKAKEKLDFIEARFQEKKQDYERLQDDLADLRDKNLRLTTEESKVALSRLQAEYDVALKIFTELSTQLETQRIQVKEDTPVFTTINPVSIPVEKSKPRRALILIFWTFLGGFFGVAWIIGVAVFKSIRSQLTLSS